MAVTGEQVRTGRAFARLSAADLASLARVGRMTIVRAELTNGVPPTTEADLFSIQTVLEAMGVVFGPDGSVNYRPGNERR